MHCRNTTFAYNNEFKEYMKVEGVISKDIFDYLFGVRIEKFIPHTGKKCLLELFEKWQPEHLQLDEGFNEYLHNDGLEDIVGD